LDRRHELIGDYSLGMRKKIGILAALAGDPKLLLLDEPLNGLDAESMRRLRVRLEERAAAGAAVVLSSHVMGFVERVCGRVVILKKGRGGGERNAGRAAGGGADAERGV
jgi:ABC-2 type transport system ATP-binding protein